MKKKTSILTIALALMLCITAGCAQTTDVTDEPSSEAGAQLAAADVAEMGSGETTFALEVTDDTGAKTIFRISTDETTIGAALVKLELIDGDVSNLGLMVTTVNSLKADYNTDGAYWAFYIDGEYAMTGVDATPIEQDRIYALVYEKA